MVCTSIEMSVNKWAVKNGYKISEIEGGLNGRFIEY